MAEKWEDIPEHPGCKISSYGRFMRDNKINDFSGGRSGRYAVILNQSVHSLVAKFFIGERPGSCVINHKDRNKRNNRIDNLEYISKNADARHWRGVEKPRNNYPIAQLNASIPESLMKELKVIAKKEKRSISNLISLLLEKDVERIKSIGVL